MASAFHHFHLLPLELRQRIWELSLTPRRVPAGDFSDIRSLTYPPPLPPPVPPPAALHACTESRSHLGQQHTKMFIEGSPSGYIWVNYELDTICIADSTIDEHPDILPPIKHLSVHATDSQLFWHMIMDHIQSMPSLEDVEIRPIDEGSLWWYSWFQVMRSWYYTDAPVRFRTTILSPIPNHMVPMLTPDNFIKVERDQRRRDMAANPEMYGGREMSDSDDDVRAPGRRHPGGK